MFWTVQHYKVIDILLENRTYNPDFEISNNYEHMKFAYKYILEHYNKKNYADVKGLIFGFGAIGDVDNYHPMDLLDYLRKKLPEAFPFWTEEYCLLKLDISYELDLVPLDFNDFIKLASYLDPCRTNEILNLENNIRNYNSNYSFKDDISKILKNLNRGTVDPILRSFTQLHSSQLDVDSILEIHPLVNISTGKKFELNESSNKLNELIG